MTTLLLLTTFACLGKSAPDTNLKPLISEFRKIERYLETPPEYANSDTSFYYAELLILEISKSGKVRDVTLNDHAPDWLKQNVRRIKEANQLNYKKLDSLGMNSAIKNCKLIFPLIIESDNFPGKTTRAKEHIGNNFYQIKGKNISGSILFMDPIHFVWPMKGKS